MYVYINIQICERFHKLLYSGTDFFDGSDIIMNYDRYHGIPTILILIHNSLHPLCAKAAQELFE